MRGHGSPQRLNREESQVDEGTGYNVHARFIHNFNGDRREHCHQGLKHRRNPLAGAPCGVTYASDLQFVPVAINSGEVPIVFDWRHSDIDHALDPVEGSGKDQNPDNNSIGDPGRFLVFQLESSPPTGAPPTRVTAVAIAVLVLFI